MTTAIGCIWTAFAYLLGTLSFSYILVRQIAKVDLRTQGSGNLGATNAGRVLGKRWALIIYVLDLAKGLVAAGLPRLVMTDEAVLGLPMPLAGGLAVVLGHVFPFWLGFKGGKGVATGSGVVFAVAPATGACALLAWLLTVRISRIVSLASILATLSLPILHPFVEPRGTRATTLFLAAIAALVIFLHRANIRRILAGEEHRTGRPKP